ncbi:hypothetical protein [Pelagibius sp.]|uniref:hypothetical protein n=1 Tax=Pelagibius sp. TaxID=1931238 RepID=UPI003BAF3250
MTEPLQRDELIALLSKLGSPEDEEVLTAARQLHGNLEAAGTSWDELILPEEPEDYEPALDDEAEDEFEDEGEEEAVEDEPLSPEQQTAQNAEALALIEKLLARPDSSAALREELEGYKEDIAEDEFTAADYRYLLALQARLTK